MRLGVTEQVAERIMEQMRHGMSDEVTVKNLKASFEPITTATGYPFLVIPSEAADQLSDLGDSHIIGRVSDNMLTNASRAAIRAWKPWTLLNPKRFVKYGTNNAYGDAEAMFAFAPEALFRDGNPLRGWSPFMRQAWKELWGHYVRGEKMSDGMRQAFGLGVFDSTRIHGDYESAFMQRHSRKLTGQGRSPLARLLVEKQADWEALWKRGGGNLADMWRGMMEVIMDANQFREGLMRYALYLSALDQLKTGKALNYGAADPAYVDAQRTPEIKASIIATKTMGDYTGISVIGAWLRANLFPFWSWLEVNPKRWWQGIKNVWNEASAGGAGFWGRLGIVATTAGGRNLLTWGGRALALQATIMAWNYLFGPSDPEKYLSEYDRRKTIIWLPGQDPERAGQATFWRLQSSINDILDWFGLSADFWNSETASLTRDMMRGRTSPAQAVIELAKKPANKLVQALSPTLIGPAELGLGYTVFPDVSAPRSIRDRAEYVARIWDAGEEYRGIRDFWFPMAKPRAALGWRGYWPAVSLRVLGLTTTDAEAAPFFDILAKKYRFLEDVLDRGGTSGRRTGRRSALLYEYKRALRMGDDRTLDRLDAIMRAEGISPTASIRRGRDVLAGISKSDRARFIQWLTPDERHELQAAQRFAEKAYQAWRDR